MYAVHSANKRLSREEFEIGKANRKWTISKYSTFREALRVALIINSKTPDAVHLIEGDDGSSYNRDQVAMYIQKALQMA
jgi:hypothetical protein